MGKNFRIIAFIIIFLIPVASYAAGDVKVEFSMMY